MTAQMLRRRIVEQLLGEMEWLPGSDSSSGRDQSIRKRFGKMIQLSSETPGPDRRG